MQKILFILKHFGSSLTNHCFAYLSLTFLLEAIPVPLMPMPFA
jgi:hypothetical protein